MSAAAAASAVGVAVAATVSGALIGRAPDSSGLSGRSFVPSNQRCRTRELPHGGDREHERRDEAQLGEEDAVRLAEPGAHRDDEVADGDRDEGADADRDEVRELGPRPGEPGDADHHREERDREQGDRQDGAGGALDPDEHAQEHEEQADEQVAGDRHQQGPPVPDAVGRPAAEAMVDLGLCDGAAPIVVVMRFRSCRVRR